MHPYIAHQLARHKDDELRRKAEFARLASARRRARRKGLRWPLQLLRSRHDAVGATPPIDVCDEPFPSQLAEDPLRLKQLPPARPGRIRLCADPRAPFRPIEGPGS